MDDGHIWLEIIIIILLVLANGVCSLAEIAIVGARKTKLQEMIDEGNKSAGYALRLAERKEELFSTIQVGITTISIITGMFSGASLSGPLGEELSKFPPLAPYAQMVSMVAVMVLVTYFSLIIGELAPKWIAIAIPEKAACFVARPMIIMATVCKPLVLFPPGLPRPWWVSLAFIWKGSSQFRKRKSRCFSSRGPSWALLIRKNRKSLIMYSSLMTARQQTA